jgi:hypothetical protein
LLLLLLFVEVPHVAVIAFWWPLERLASSTSHEPIYLLFLSALVLWYCLLMMDYWLYNTRSGLLPVFQFKSIDRFIFIFYLDFDVELMLGMAQVFMREKSANVSITCSLFLRKRQAPLL